MKTSVPPGAKRSAIARPSPVEPPVTQIATGSAPRQVGDDLVAGLDLEADAEALDHRRRAFAQRLPLLRFGAPGQRPAVGEDHLGDPVVQRLPALEAVRRAAR